MTGQNDFDKGRLERLGYKSYDELRKRQIELLKEKIEGGNLTTQQQEFYVYWKLLDGEVKEDNGGKLMFNNKQIEAGEKIKIGSVEITLTQDQIDDIIELHKEANRIVDHPELLPENSFFRKHPMASYGLIAAGVAGGAYALYKTWNWMFGKDKVSVSRSAVDRLQEELDEIEQSEEDSRQSWFWGTLKKAGLLTVGAAGMVGVGYLLNKENASGKYVQGWISKIENETLRGILQNMTDNRFVDFGNEIVHGNFSTSMVPLLSGTRTSEEITLHRKIAKNGKLVLTSEVGEEQQDDILWMLGNEDIKELVDYNGDGRTPFVLRGLVSGAPVIQDWLAEGGDRSVEAMMKVEKAVKDLAKSNQNKDKVKSGTTVSAFLGMADFSNPASTPTPTPAP